MRQGQQNRRGRTRSGQNNHTTSNSSTNNRKGQNPISRTYQSNGPDGKVSGTASGIAEKYLSMARDATTSGDPVLAENYLQHAEHYNRIILAYRESQSVQNGTEGASQRSLTPGEADNADDQGDDEGETYGRDMQPLPPMEIAQRPQPEPQPRAFDQPREPRDGQNRQDNLRQDNPRQDNPRFEDRQPRYNDGQPRRPNGQPQQNQSRDRDDRFPRERYQPERFNNGDRDRGPERQNGGGNDRSNGQNAQNNQPRAERFQNDRVRNDRPQYGERQHRPNDRAPNDRPANERASIERNEDRARDGQTRDGQTRDQQPRPEFNRPDGAADNRSETRSDLRAERSEQPRPSFQPRDASRDTSEPSRSEAAFAETPSPELFSKIDQSPTSREPALREPTVRAPRPPRRATPTIVAEHEQPEFLRRPVRRPRKEAAEGATPTAAAPEVAVVTPPVPDREPTQD